MTPLRWGFMSTAGIGRKNWQALSQADNGVLTVVAGRDAGRCERYIDECQADAPFAVRPRAIGGYEALIAAPDVDAVYIPLPTALRAEWVIRAARAGKHVLCEKPCAINADGLETMLAACREHRVQFMDGVMFMHHHRMAQVRKVLDDGVSTGQIRRITSTFSFQGAGEFFQKNIRVHPELEPAGCLGDLGWYCLRIALWALRWQAPLEVTGRILSGTGQGPAAVPLEFSGELVFADGVSAGFYCSFTAPLQQWVNVSGTQGWLRMDDFVHPNPPLAPTFQLNGVEVPVPAGAADAGGPRAQDVNMFRHFAEQVRSGRLNTDWPQWSLKTQLVQDACLRSARNGGRPEPVGAF